jgi:hypothetical protein
VNKYLLACGIIVFAIVIIFLIRSPEDDWIKDSRGVWIKHGVPSSIPNYVSEQQQIISCALNLYDGEKNKNITFNNQCLGTCGDYAIDIVHSPRTSEDDLPENQCDDYKNGKVGHFLELDKNEEVVRII